MTFIFSNRQVSKIGTLHRGAPHGFICGGTSDVSYSSYVLRIDINESRQPVRVIVCLCPLIYTAIMPDTPIFCGNETSLGVKMPGKPRILYAFALGGIRLIWLSVQNGIRSREIPQLHLNVRYSKSCRTQYSS